MAEAAGCFACTQQLAAKAVTRMLDTSNAVPGRLIRASPSAAMASSIELALDSGLDGFLSELEASQTARARHLPRSRDEPRSTPSGS